MAPRTRRPHAGGRENSSSNRLVSDGASIASPPSGSSCRLAPPSPVPTRSWLQLERGDRARTRSVTQENCTSFLCICYGPSMTARVDTGTTPMRLLMAVTRLRARARTEGGTERTGLTLMQLAILGRVTNEGSRTAAQLAQSEHVSQQAIAQSLAGLKERRLVQLRPDPDDGRKALIELTAAGRELLDSLVGAREAWLARAIDEVVRARRTRDARGGDRDPRTAGGRADGRAPVSAAAETAGRDEFPRRFLLPLYVGTAMNPINTSLIVTALVDRARDARLGRAHRRARRGPLPRELGRAADGRKAGRGVRAAARVDGRHPDRAARRNRRRPRPELHDARDRARAARDRHLGGIPLLDAADPPPCRARGPGRLSWPRKSAASRSRPRSCRPSASRSGACSRGCSGGARSSS